MAAPNLIDRLRALLPDSPQRASVSEHETRRRGLAVLLSVVVAFVLWFTFSMRESYSVVVDMPLMVRNLPEGRALRSLPPAEARVTVAGEGWELLKLSRRPPEIDISARGEAVDIHGAASESNRLPPGVTVVSTLPNIIELDLEPRITRTLPVRLRARIETTDLFDLLDRPSVEPDTIVVSGARSIVNGLQFWPTEMIVREGVNETIAERIPLSDTLRGLVQKSLQEVDLNVPVTLFTEAERELSVRTEGAPPGADPIRFIPASVSVTYRIPMEEFEASQESDEFYAFVPYADAMNDTTGAVQPVIHLPAGLNVGNARIAPRRLQYRIRVE